MANAGKPRLYQALIEYSGSEMYPFHMPGHKRQAGCGPAASFPNPYRIDITEIDGFDNLHHPEGVLRESMDWAAGVYGSDRTYYLVNGSTAGVLSAICAAADSAAGQTGSEGRRTSSVAGRTGSVCGPTSSEGRRTGSVRGRKLLMARNSHKSAYHALFLEGLEARYLYPGIVEGMGIQGGIRPEEVEAALEEDQSVAAVFLTSPTYDGVVSDIRRIAEVCHRYGVPLIVDEAHGAHFPFGSAFPEQALDLGADLVVQSLHKTLPAFTQTAVLHLRRGLIDEKKLEHYLQVFQSSSPSYVLMAGIERCIWYMDGPGRRQMEEFSGRLRGLRSRLAGMKNLRLLGQETAKQAGAFDLDESRIVVSFRGTGIDRARMEERMRNRYHLEMEMYGADYVTAIVTLMDTEEGLKRLEQAFLETDGVLRSRPQQEKAPAGCGPQAGTPESCPQQEKAPAGRGPQAGTPESCPQQEKVPVSCGLPEEAPEGRPLAAGLRGAMRPAAAMTIREAWERPARTVELEASAGRVSAEYVYLYPPGIPLIVPGEIMTAEMVRLILTYRQKGLPIQGLHDAQVRRINIVETSQEE